MLGGDGPHQAPLACVLWVEVIIFMRHYSCLVYPRATPNCVSLAIKGFIRHAESPAASSRGKNRVLLEAYHLQGQFAARFRAPLRGWHLKKGQNLFLSSEAGKWESGVKMGKQGCFCTAARVTFLSCCELEDFNMLKQCLSDFSNSECGPGPNECRCCLVLGEIHFNVQT